MYNYKEKKTSKKLSEENIFGVVDYAQDCKGNKEKYRAKLNKIKDKISPIVNIAEGLDWFAYNEIDENYDNPKDIANKMIALYDLLKKEGF